MVGLSEPFSILLSSSKFPFKGFLPSCRVQVGTFHCPTGVSSLSLAAGFLRELPDMMSSSEGGGGSWKSSKGGCLYYYKSVQMQTRVERVKKTPKILRMSLIKAP